MKTQDMLKNEAQVRASFWENHPQFTRKTKRIPFTQAGIPCYRAMTQNEYSTDVRCAFVDWVDYLHRSGMISDNLENRVTL